MFLSGISDEAGKPIDVQIKAHQELGWQHLEIRCVDGEQLTAVSDEKFGDIYDQVTGAGMHVSCFASAIANWARPITGDFQVDADDLKQAIPRMHRFETPFIRVMSYPNDKDHPIEEREWRKEAIRRMKELSRIAEDGGVIMVHENCSGWGGLSAENSNILLGEVDSPALKLVYDTGNPVIYEQDAWEYYQAVQKDIVYVHIKDGTKDGESNNFTFPGEGNGRVRETVADLLARGYDGGISIEPHLGAVIHEGTRSDEDSLYATYTEYGRRFMQILEEVKPG